MPQLSIIIVTYNTKADLDRCLRGLHRNTALPHEIVVVDNASTDGTAAAVKAGWPEVRLIESPVNVGFARANNLAMRATEGELILLLNPDTVPRAGVIDTLVNLLYARPDVAAIGPRLVDADGHPELSFGKMIGPFAELRQKTILRFQSRGAGWARQYVERVTRKERYTDWVSGACLLMRRADVEAVGYFDERFFIYTEDVDLCAAMRSRGRSIMFTPEAEILHLRGRSAATAPAVTSHAHRRSHLAFYAKHHPRWAPLLRLYLGMRGQLPPAA